MHTLISTQLPIFTRWSKNPLNHALGRGTCLSNLTSQRYFIRGKNSSEKLIFVEEVKEVAGLFLDEVLHVLLALAELEKVVRDVQRGEHGYLL